MTLIFDTETTGKADFNKPATDEAQPRLVQLGAMLLDEELRTVAELNVMIKPVGFTIPDEVAKIHGITQAKADKYGIDELQALQMFKSLCGLSKRLVAHNIRFDGIIIGRANHLHGLEYTPPEPYCTMDAATNICKIPGTRGYTWPSLQEAHQILLGEGFDGAHDAMADVRACARVYECLIHGGKPKERPAQPARKPVENVPDLREYDDETPMPFGKYRGTPLGELPSDYCQWLYDQRDLSDQALYRWLHGSK